jgi:hypothetical protein
MYDGFFDNNMFQGHGTLLLSNGDRFVGQFSNGLISSNYNNFKYDVSNAAIEQRERDWYFL